MSKNGFTFLVTSCPFTGNKPNPSSLFLFQMTTKPVATGYYRKMLSKTLGFHPSADFTGSIHFPVPAGFSDVSPRGSERMKNHTSDVLWVELSTI